MEAEEEMGVKERGVEERGEEERERGEGGEEAMEEEMESENQKLVRVDLTGNEGSKEGEGTQESKSSSPKHQVSSLASASSASGSVYGSSKTSEK